MPHFFSSEKNTKIHYETYGDPGKPALVMIHGLASDSNIWKPQVAYFKDDFFVVTFDFPGHGDSDWQETYNIHEIPTIIRDLLDHLEIEKAHLMALSIGCSTALLTSVHYPQRVRTLVLQGPVGGIQKFAQAPYGWLEWVQLKLSVNATLIGWRLLGRPLAGKLINRMGQRYRYSTIVTGEEQKVDDRVLRGYAYTNGDGPYIGLLDGVKVPVLVIRGREDQFPAKYAQYILDHIKVLRLWMEVPHAQHLVALEKSLEFNFAAKSFLTEIEGLDVGKILQEAQSVKNEAHPSAYTVN